MTQAAAITARCYTRPGFRRNSDIFLAALALGVCSVGCGTPAFGSVTPTQNPLVARYIVSLPVGATAVVEFGLDTHYGSTTSPVSATAPTVPILVAGMKQNSTYHMRAIITHANGRREFDRDRIFTTGAAPAARVPSMTLTQPSGVTPAPGVELVCLNPLPNNPGNYLRVLALNPAGEIIWYYDFDPDLGTAQPIKLLPNGHFVLVLFGGTTGPGGMVREINLAGETLREFTVERLNQWLAVAGYRLHANAIHHDIAPLPNGHILVLVNTRKSFTNLPGRRGVTSVLGDAIVDLDPNYNPVWMWSSFDHLDVNRHPMMFPDWTHANSILYSPDDGNILLSLRNQSWLVKIDYANGRGSGNILWKLGYQGDFTLRSNSPAEWFFAQHFVSFIGPRSTGDFQIALFDNGNNRFPDFSGTICPSTAGETLQAWPAFFGIHVPDCYSRPVNLAINESARTAQLLWSQTMPYSYWGGVNMPSSHGNMFLDDTSISSLVAPSVADFRQRLLRNVIEALTVLILVLLIFFWRMPTAIIPFFAIPIAVIFAFVPAIGIIALVIAIFLDGIVMVLAADDKLNRNSWTSGFGKDKGRGLAPLHRLARPSFLTVVLIALWFFPAFAPVDRPSARIEEVRPHDPPQLIWELDVNGQESYRTIHIPSLYPGVQW